MASPETRERLNVSERSREGKRDQTRTYEENVDAERDRMSRTGNQTKEKEMTTDKDKEECRQVTTTVR